MCANLTLSSALTPNLKNNPKPDIKSAPYQVHFSFSDHDHDLGRFQCGVRIFSVGASFV